MCSQYTRIKEGLADVMRHKLFDFDQACMQKAQNGMR